MATLSRYLPFAASATPLQAATYLLGISLFSISFLVFLNSSVSFVITDLIGVKDRVGDIVGTLGFVDEVVALIACPIWGLVSDRLGVRWVAVIGYAVIGLALVLFVQARNVYPQLLLARIFFAIGATAAATMVTAVLPSLTDESDSPNAAEVARKTSHNARDSAVLSLESELTITPERFARTESNGQPESDAGAGASSLEREEAQQAKPPRLAGLVGVFTGCGALVALSVFLPLPARFGRIDGVTQAQAVTYSFYVVAVIALLVASFVFVGLQNLKGEDGKGWRVLFGLRGSTSQDRPSNEGEGAGTTPSQVLPYFQLLRDSIKLGFSDSQIALGYLGGFVARASTVAISLFVPLFVNTFFISNGFCQGSPNDPSPELKKECRAAYILASILTGVAQLMGLICAPLFGYASSYPGRVNVPVIVATVFGIAGYIAFPMLSSPEYKNADGRGGTPMVFLIVSLIGISQIGAIVCSLGSLGRGVLTADLPKTRPSDESGTPEAEAGEGVPLLGGGAANFATASRVRLKGSIAGVYSWCGGAAILLLTKLGGYLFDEVSSGAPFYMMAIFNAILLIASVGIDISREIQRKRAE